MKLICFVAGRQCHLIQFRNIPAFDDMSARTGIILQAFDQQADLINALFRPTE